jgi:hypothetical protein
MYGSVTAGFECLRVDAGTAGSLRYGVVSTTCVCCGSDTEMYDANSEPLRLFYAVRAFAWALHIAYCYGRFEYSETPFRLLDLVIPSDQELGVV